MNLSLYATVFSCLIMLFINTWLILILLLFTCLPQSIAAQSDGSWHFIKTSSSQAITKQMATSIAQQHIKGRVLSVELEGSAYRVKILSDQGSVHILSINANDGTVISSN